MPGQDYYESRKPRLLRDFDKSANLVLGSIATSYGADFADTLYREVRREYEELIPQTPRVEGVRARPLNSFLLISGQALATYRVMKKRGRSAGEAWEICHHALRLWMEKLPRLKRWLFGDFLYSGIVRKRLRKLSESGRRLRLGNFEIKYIEGDGESFDFGVDYMACGIHKFMLEQGAAEFAPYVCIADIAFSDAMGWGLIRTETLADGCKRCDFRFKKGAKTRVSSITPDVQAAIERIIKKEAELSRPDHPVSLIYE
jgi:hypothetical protein